MSTIKVKADLPVYAELRELGAAIDSDERAVVGSWFTPEFWTMAVTVVTNLFAVAMVLGWLTAAEVETLTKTVTAMLGAAEVIIVNGLLVWKFISDRTALRAEALHAKYRLMEAVTIERLRAQ